MPKVADLRITARVDLPAHKGHLDCGRLNVTEMLTKKCRGGVCGKANSSMEGKPSAALEPHRKETQLPPNDNLARPKY